MDKGMVFWMLMILAVVFGMYSNWPEDRSSFRTFAGFGGNLLVFILLALLGWQVFGQAIR